MNHHPPPLQLIDLSMIRKSAQFSADQCLGPQSNPHPEDSPEFKEWLKAYYSKVQSNAVECAA